MPDGAAAHGLAVAGMIVLKSTLLLAAGAAAAQLLRRGSAAARHLIWLAVLLGLLMIPPLSFLLPRWTVPVPLPAALNRLTVDGPLLGISLPAQDADPDHKTHAGRGGATVKALPENRTLPTRSLSYPPDPTDLTDPSVPTPHPLPLALSALWLAGALVILGRLLLCFRRVRRLERGASPAAANLTARAADVQAEVGFRRQIRLLTASPAEPAALPMTWGVRRPVVLLPSGAAQWPEGRLRAVLMHEFAHVRRGDWLTQMAGQAALALYRFHPLVGWAAARLRLESERACDDQVLAWGIPPSAYATCLLEVLCMAQTTRTLTGAATPMAAAPDIERRLRGVLDPRRKRGAVSRRALCLGSVVVVLLLFPLAALRVQPASAASKAAQGAEHTAQVERTELERRALRARLAQTELMLTELRRQLDAARAEMHRARARERLARQAVERQRAAQHRLTLRAYHLQAQAGSARQRRLEEHQRLQAPREASRAARGTDDHRQRLDRRRLEQLQSKLAEIELRLSREESRGGSESSQVTELKRVRLFLLREVERLKTKPGRRGDGDQPPDPARERLRAALETELLQVELKLVRARVNHKETDPQVRELEAQRQFLQRRLELESTRR